MIAPLLMLQAAAAVPVLPDALPRQALPAQGCAVYLWSQFDRRLVAMASAEPARLRLSLGGRTLDVPRESQSGIGGLGFAGTTGYRSGDVAVTLALTVATRADLTDGAGVPEATLTIVRTGADTVVLPVAGLIGCAMAR